VVRRPQTTSSLFQTSSNIHPCHEPVAAAVPKHQLPIEPEQPPAVPPRHPELPWLEHAVQHVPSATEHRRTVGRIQDVDISRTDDLTAESRVYLEHAS